MSRNRLGTRRALRFSPSSGGVLLPLVGPFQLMPRPLSSSLPNFNYSSTTLLSGPGTKDNNAIIGNNVTLQNNVALTSDTFSIFIWANVLSIGNNSVLNTDGQNGEDISTNAGNGGIGACGGGGGAYQLGCSSEMGGFGSGDGIDGQSGSSDTCLFTAGQGGFGLGLPAISRYPSLAVGTFNYGIGGSEGVNPSTGPWGSGGDGGSTGCGVVGPQPGGGGGAGTLVTASRILNGFGVFGAGVRAGGGQRGNVGGCSQNNASDGGSGNIHMFAQKYTANTIGAFAFNVIYMYEVASDGVTILNTFINDTGHTWDHT